jgi:hypothetical protein
VNLITLDEVGIVIPRPGWAGRRRAQIRAALLIAGTVVVATLIVIALARRPHGRSHAAMTTAELTKIAQGLVPPVGTTGWRITVVRTSREGTTWAVVPILFGRVDGTPVFTGAIRDCRRFHDLLTGRADATSRSAQADPAGDIGHMPAPDPGQSGTSLQGGSFVEGPAAVPLAVAGPLSPDAPDSPPPAVPSG